METPLLILLERCWNDEYVWGEEITHAENEFKGILQLLQDMYDDGHGGEYRDSIQEILVKYKEFI